VEVEVSGEFPLEDTKYGFKWGRMICERVLSDPRIGVVVWVRCEKGDGFEIRVSPKGTKIDIQFCKKETLP
jgi:hypothetical protein